MINSGKKAAYYTLGCKLNFSETSQISRQLEDIGFAKVDFDEKADLYVINTCMVTQTAEKKCRYFINKAIKKNPEAMVVVVGCYAQLKQSEIANIQGVSMILGSNEKFEIVDRISEYMANSGTNNHETVDIAHDRCFYPAFSIDERTRSFLKVQDGCDYFCTYCTIPYARGRSRNMSIREAIQSANNIHANGVKEIVITGVNIGDFGKSTGETFFDLIRALEENTSVERYRLSSIEPDLLTVDIIDFIASSKRFVHHFHIPLQAGSDKILRLMKRKYDVELFRQRVEHIRERMPFAAIGVDVITGFPGETEEDFQSCLDYLSQLEISYLHVFPYSERKNTKAATMSDKVSPQVKTERTQKLLILSTEKEREFYKKNIGRTERVLLETTRKDGMMTGFSENYIKVHVPPEGLNKGEIYPVTLLFPDEVDGMKGEITTNP